MACIGQIWRTEGMKGFYRGLSASYLGVAEGTIQWTLYEQFKALRQRRGTVREQGWVDKVGAAGAAKLIATIITYPHEVVRTRLRQAPPPGWSRPKYHGLWQTFSLVWREEGMVALYGGLAPHLLRVVPNAAVMYTIYEFVLKFGYVLLPARPKWYADTAEIRQDYHSMNAPVWALHVAQSAVVVILRYVACGYIAQGKTSIPLTHSRSRKT